MSYGIILKAHILNNHCYLDIDDVRITLKRPSFIQRYFGTLLGNPHEIAETLLAAGLQEKSLKLIYKAGFEETAFQLN